MAFPSKLTFALPLAFALFASFAPAQTTLLSCPSIDGFQETPPVATAATGSACFVLDQTAHTLSYNVTFAGLGSPEISAHIHTGAFGVPGGVTFVFGAGSPKIGVFATTPAQEATILASGMYVNIHSVVFSGGEIRGQIIPLACAPPQPGIEFCSNGTLGIDHTTPCPCSPGSMAQNGCAHSFSATGAHLGATGTANPDTAQLQTTLTPATSFGLYMQHQNTGDAVFHDGVLCASNPLIRLRGRASVGGASQFPDPAFPQDATLTLSTRGAVTPGSGSLRFYAVWYRNASTTFCPPATANVTNGYAILW
jgi:hypothetical protein